MVLVSIDKVRIRNLLNDIYSIFDSYITVQLGNDDGVIDHYKEILFYMKECLVSKLTNEDYTEDLNKLILLKDALLKYNDSMFKDDYDLLNQFIEDLEEL